LQFILPPFASELQSDHRQGQNDFGTFGFIYTLVKISVPGRKLFLELLNYDTELVFQDLMVF
jgi:hypothetical protein